MKDERHETIADIVADIRAQNQGLPEDSYSLSPLVCDLLSLADRIEASYKRIADSIHRAMVLNAGIEMEDFKNPPRLSTALDDIYHALSDALGIRDALGTDGYISSDIEEAKAIGRHFVIKSYGNAAKMRDALEEISREIWESIDPFRNDDCCKPKRELAKIADAALSAPPRNCDVGKPEEQQDRFREFCRRHFDARECGLGRSVAKCPAYQGGKNPDCSLWWAQMPYDEAKGEMK